MSQRVMVDCSGGTLAGIRLTQCFHFLSPADRGSHPRGWLFAGFGGSVSALRVTGLHETTASGETLGSVDRLKSTAVAMMNELGDQATEVDGHGLDPVRLFGAREQRDQTGANRASSEVSLDGGAIGVELERVALGVIPSRAFVVDDIDRTVASLHHQIERRAQHGAARR